MRPTPTEMEARLRAFYDTHNPQNRQNIAEIVLKYRGKEAVLCAKLEKKYGVAPDLLSLANVGDRATNAPPLPAPEYDRSFKIFNASPAKPVDDPACDFYAPTFDALKALHARALAPPVAGLKPLDNIHKCRHLLPVADPNYQKLATIVPTKKPPKTKSTDSAPSSPREPQLFEALADTYLDGPFTLLRRCFLARARVCVVVRRVNSVRGTLRGYLKAFDKHMNLVLLDVQQQWIPPQLYAAQDRAKRHARDTGSRVPDEEVPVLSVADARRNRSFTTTSYAKQLFVRGDNVVMVLHDKTTTTTASTTSTANKRRDYAPVARR